MGFLNVCCGRWGGFLQMSSLSWILVCSKCVTVLISVWACVTCQVLDSQAIVLPFSIFSSMVLSLYDTHMFLFHFASLSKQKAFKWKFQVKIKFLLRTIDPVLWMWLTCLFRTQCHWRHNAKLTLAGNCSFLLFCALGLLPQWQRLHEGERIEDQTMESQCKLHACLMLCLLTKCKP